MMDADTTLTVARAFIDAINRGDRAGAKTHLTDDVTRSQPLDEQTIVGPEAVAADIWSYRNSFPDLQMTVTDGFAADDRAVLQFTARGTYEPFTYGQHAPQVTWRGCLIVTAQAGKIAALDIYVDWLGPIEQLGGQGIIPVLKREGANH